MTAARAASRLSDPRMAQVFDVEDAGGQPYIVLEWVGGDSLTELLDSGPLDPALDEQGGGHRGHPLVTLPHLGRADDVHHAGLVLQAEEHHPARGRRLLLVGDQAGHGHV